MREAEADRKAEKPEGPVMETSGTRPSHRAERQTRAARQEGAGEEGMSLMEEVLRRENMIEAHARVVANGGAAGVDGVTVEELLPYCRKHWARIREELLSGHYRPQPVRRVEIPKPGGGKRMLGIPTVLDRMIQQALLQVLQPRIDPTFAEESFGFRPGRSAHGAVERARAIVAEGYDWVVDLDLEKFFDRVNHDILMSRVAGRVRDKRVLLLIRRYLQAGMLEGGLVSPRSEGTPQGGPLSPLLSNILLDELDGELRRRGHRFVRYADDANVYVRSKAAGERVMASLERFLWERLRLKVNRDKSAVARPWERKFLGYRITAPRRPKLAVAPESLRRLRQRVQQILRRGRGRALPSTIRDLNELTRGWVAYFRKAELRGCFGEIDVWIRRKLRAILWRQWKTPRTRFHELRRRGIDPDYARRAAYSGRGAWWSSRSGPMMAAVPTAELQRLGLSSLLAEYKRLARST